MADPSRMFQSLMAEAGLIDYYISRRLKVAIGRLMIVQ